MKRLFAFFVSLCLGLSCWSEEVVVQLYGNPLEDRTYDERSINLGPTATIDEGILRIDTNVSVAYVWVVIKDDNGNVVYSGYDGTTARSHQFAMGDLPEGCYTLEINLSGNDFWGDFCL